MLNLEQLEPRDAPAVTVNVTYSDSTTLIRVVGDQERDRIAIIGLPGNRILVASNSGAEMIDVRGRAAVSVDTGPGRDDLFVTGTFFLALASPPGDSPEDGDRVRLFNWRNP